MKSQNDTVELGIVVPVLNNAQEAILAQYTSKCIEGCTKVQIAVHFALGRTPQLVNEMFPIKYRELKEKTNIFLPT